MSLDTALFIGLGVFLGLLLLLQIYLAYRLRKYRQAPTQTSGHLTAKESFRFGLFHTLFYGYMLIVAVYSTWTGKFSLPLGIGLGIVGLMSIRKPLTLVRDHRPVHADASVTLPLFPRATNTVTPELIQELLADETLVNAIRMDLEKIHRIRGHEQWRLGLITPDTDKYNSLYQIPVKRAAIIHPITFFNAQFQSVLINHGTRAPMIQSYPGWSYRLRTLLSENQYEIIRALEINTNSASANTRNSNFPKFLREDGFPLKDSYRDGDPLTTERGGTLVLDQGKPKLIYSNYFIQSRLIDDEGTLIYMGLDENFQPSATWSGISVIPSVSKKLFKTVQYEGYVPILRYRSFPYASDYMLPILDTPMSDSGWADLFIDTRGKAKLFIAKQKTLAEWYEMMDRLRQLFFGELEKKGNHLLGLTKDQQHLNEYFFKKQRIRIGLAVGTFFCTQCAEDLHPSKNLMVNKRCLGNTSIRLHQSVQRQ
jgi:hypothetical protein